MVIKEIDFKLIKDKAESKVFKFTNADGTVYDMTNSTASCKLYLDPESPVSITCNIDVPNGKITIPFTSTHTVNNGTFEYILEEDVGGTGTILALVKGNTTVLDYTPFSETLQAYLNSELPANITLTEDYRNQRIFYWRRILQTAFEITDVNLNVEEEWPILANALLAKLVVYDATMLASRGSFIAFMGGDYTSPEDLGGPVSKIETGPTSVEFHSTSKALGEVFQRGASGVSAFDTMLVDLCGLASFLKVKIPMCKGNYVPMIPKYCQNPDWAYPTLGEMDDGIWGQVSQG